MTRRTNQFFLFVFLYYLIMSMFIGPLLSALPITPLLWQFIVKCLIFVPILLIFIYTERQVSFKECFSLRKISIKNAILCLCIGFFVLPFISLISLLVSPLQPNLAEESMNSLQDSGLLFMVIVSAVQPAVFEELTFRGIALHGYRQHGARTALLMSAFLFGMLHMNLQQALYAFALGIVFAFLVQRTGSIFASILPHFTINACNVTANYLSNLAATATTTTTETVTATPTFLQQLMAIGLMCIIFLPILALCIFLFCRCNPKQPETVSIASATAGQPKEKLFSASIIIIIIIFVVFGVLPNLYIFQS